MEFQTHKLLKRIRTLAKAMLEDDSSLENSLVLSEICCRRLYVLTCFFTLSLEFLALSGLDHLTGSAGPLQFPFKGIESATSDSDLVDGKFIVLLNTISNIV